MPQNTLAKTEMNFVYVPACVFVNIRKMFNLKGEIVTYWHEIQDKFLQIIEDETS